MRELIVTIEIWQKGNLYLASAPELDFISQGKTSEEAKKNLLEVIKIQFEEMAEMGTLKEYLSECGFVTEDDRIVPKKEIVGFEKSVVKIT
jgi:predicted RNase H-like HicB family nuclease